MDSSTAQVMTTVATVSGTVLVAWIAYRQAQLNRKVDKVSEQTNGILEATKTAKDHAEGRAEAAVEIAVKQPPAPPI